MTNTMNSPALNLANGRKRFPFDVSHLRTGTEGELGKGVWERRKGYEGKKEKLLKPTEQLEVEIIDLGAWTAAIQSSESLLLSQYESFLEQHERPGFRDSAITSANEVLGAVDTTRVPATELVDLRNFLEIVLNYIKRGQDVDVKGEPSKFAFRLMSRTNFASMYKSLLSEKARALFRKIVRDDEILKQMGLDRKTKFFVSGYGEKVHETGPTVYEWLAGIYHGKDLLSDKGGRNISDAMGKYDVEKRGKDRGLVKFETRGTEMGRVKPAAEWLRLWIHAIFGGAP